jgi:hypothetical protein
MKTSSLWKLTFDPTGTPLVLLDYGDWMEGELVFPLQRGVEIVPLIDAVAPFIRSTGNAVVTINVRKIRSVAAYDAIAADNAAREAVLDDLIAVAAATKKILQIQLYNFTDHYWRFANCVISGMETGRLIESPLARVHQSFTLTCTGLAKSNGTP